MDSVVLLLLISMAWLYNENGLATSESAEYDEELQIPCGITTASTGIEFRITNRGTNSKYLEFPWMVALFIPKVKRRRCALADNRCWNFRCGGSLISSMVVLTTAQCIVDYKYGKIKVRAGDWNLDTLEEPLPYQERSVSKIIIHPQYYRGSRAKYRRYDAALLIVNSPYLLADNIGFICLPPPNHRMASTSCKFAGWGVQIFRTPGYQALLKVVDLNYLGHNQCQTTLRRNWFSRLRLHESSTCAGGVRGKGVCQGDGGGPLMCIEDYRAIDPTTLCPPEWGHYWTQSTSYGGTTGPRVCHMGAQSAPYRILTVGAGVRDVSGPREKMGVKIILPTLTIYCEAV